MSQTVTQAVAQREQTPIEMVRSYQPRFAAILPEHINTDTFMTLALGALRNDDIAKAARNNPLALMVALTNCARLGHQPNTEAYYLVPFKGVITGIEGYRGVVERMYRAGGVSSVHGRVVRANDHYEFEEGMPHPIHRYSRFATEAERGARIGAYAYARLRDGGYSQVVEASAEEIAKHRDMNTSSSSAFSPWVKWPDPMWCKVPLRALEKLVPSSAEYRQQIALANAAAIQVAEDAGLPADAAGEVLEGDVIWPETAAAGGAV